MFDDATTCHEPATCPLASDLRASATMREAAWFGIPPPPHGAHVVQIWVRKVGGHEPPAAALRTLNDEECARAARFLKARDRWRFIEARALLRFALGRELG